MLDFAALKRQIDGMVAERQSAQQDSRSRLKLALAEVEKWDSRWEALLDKIRGSRTSWLVARPAAPFSQAHPAPERPAQLTVIASDGSQIFPDRHEVARCYLINIGYVVIHYGTGERPLLASRPHLFYREEEVYQDWAGRRTSVSREMVGVKRGTMELSQVAVLAEQARSEGRTAVALTDGTLILWMLEGKPPDFRGQTVAAAVASFEKLRRTGAPVVGYISDPRSTDVVNGLRVGICPQTFADCDRCPWKSPEMQRGGGAGQTPDQGPRAGIPCEPLAGLTDNVLYGKFLREGERSGVFESSSRILEDYGPHRIRFFYVHTGSEVARVEVPLWAAEDRALLDLVHATVLDQAEKGGGYPVALTESHERAVVRAAERDIFYKFLRDSFVKRDIRAAISAKGLKKQTASV